MAKKAEAVRCAECGLLAVADRREGTYHEADQEFRDTGIWKSYRGEVFDDYFPACFVQAFDLFAESRERSDPSQVWENASQRSRYVVTTSGVRNTVTCVRKCRSWTPWLLGLHPREHREMVMSTLLRESQARIEKANRAALAAQRKSDEAWRAEQRRLDQESRARRDVEAAERHKEQMGLLRTQHRSGLRVLGWFMAGAIVLSTLVGAMIQAGWIPNPWGTASPSAPQVTVIVPPQAPPQVIVNNVLPTPDRGAP